MVSFSYLRHHTWRRILLFLPLHYNKKKSNFFEEIKQHRRYLCCFIVLKHCLKEFNTGRRKFFVHSLIADIDIVDWLRLALRSGKLILDTCISLKGSIFTKHHVGTFFFLIMHSLSLAIQ